MERKYRKAVTIVALVALLSIVAICAGLVVTVWYVEIGTGISIAGMAALIGCSWARNIIESAWDEIGERGKD